MGFASTIIKYLLFFFNLFFLVAGLALLGLGVGVQLRLSSVLALVENGELDVKTGPMTTMVLGTIVFFIAFYGCFGSIKQNNLMLVSYAVIMVVLMVVKIVLAVIVFAGRDELVAAVPKVLNQAFTANQTDFHALESELDCCGTSGPEVYDPAALPASCCAAEACTVADAYPGCSIKLGSIVVSFSMLIGSMTIFVAAIEVFAVVFSLCLANHGRHERRRTRR